MKKFLEVGDKIQRFEVSLTREIESLNEVISVTKTLAKTQMDVFKRELIYTTTHPKNSKHKIIAMVNINKKTDWSSPSYFLVQEIYQN